MSSNNNKSQPDGLPVTALAPRHGQVIVAPWHDPSKPKSQLELPEGAMRDVILHEQKGVVLAVGPGSVAPMTGQRCPMDLVRGDIVVLCRSGSIHDGAMEVDDPTCDVFLLAVDERSIVAKLSREPIEVMAAEKGDDG